MRTLPKALSFFILAALIVAASCTKETLLAPAPQASPEVSNEMLQFDDFESYTQKIKELIEMSPEAFAKWADEQTFPSYYKKYQEARKVWDEEVMEHTTYEAFKKSFDQFEAKYSKWVDILEEDGYYIRPKIRIVFYQALINENSMLQVGENIFFHGPNRQVIFPLTLLKDPSFAPTAVEETDEARRVFVLHQPEPFFRDEFLGCSDKDSDNNKRISCNLYNTTQSNPPLPPLIASSVQVRVYADMLYEKKALFGWKSTNGNLSISGTVNSFISCSTTVPPGSGVISASISRTGSNVAFISTGLGQVGSLQNVIYPPNCFLNFSSGTSVVFDRVESPNTNDLTCTISK